MIRWIVLFCLAWAVMGHILPARGSAQRIAGRVWKPNPGQNRHCPYKGGMSLVDAPSSHLTIRSTDGPKLAGEGLAADAWSHTELANGSTILTDHITGESFVIESVVTVTEEEERKLGFPSYAGSPVPSEGTAHDAGYAGLRPRARRTEHFYGGAGAVCYYTNRNFRTIHFQAEINEEERSLALHSGRTWKPQIPAGTLTIKPGQWPTSSRYMYHTVLEYAGDPNDEAASP